MYNFLYIYFKNFLLQKIYIPGDNDIGGEGHDFRTKEKIARFERYFEYLTGSVKYRFTSFFKVSKILLNILESIRQSYKLFLVSL